MENVCGMNICKKCGTVNLIFGVLFLVASLGLFVAPWFNGWTLIGLYLLLWGVSALFMKH